MPLGFGGTVILLLQWVLGRVEVKALYIVEVEGLVITDLGKITKPVIQEDNLEELIFLISMVNFHVMRFVSQSTIGLKIVLVMFKAVTVK